VYQLQMAMIQQKRDLITSRDQLHQRHEAYQAELAQERDALVKLRKAAAKALRGYPSLARALTQPAGKEEGSPSGQDLDSLMIRARDERTKAGEALREYRRLGIPKLFSSLPVSLAVMLLILIAAGLAFGLPQAGLDPSLSRIIGAAVGVGGSLIAFVLLGIGKSQGAALAETLTSSIRHAREAQETAQKVAESDLQSTLNRLEQQVEDSSAEFDEQRKSSPEATQAERAERQQRLDVQVARLFAHHDAVGASREASLIATHQSENAELEREASGFIADLDAKHEGAHAQLTHAYEVHWNQLESAWNDAIRPVYEEIAALRTHADGLFPEWTRESLDRWKAPADFANAARLGSVDVNVSSLAKARPQSPRLALPGPDRFLLPISLVMPQRGSLLLESDGGGREEMIASLNQLILRLLS
ncbi:MAG: hypothetical protein KDL87_17820, partial [Verrucomicrobiae bacterium]|nr:hypothetical protein [Verrucomicrobiae bacterium]